MYQNKIKKYRFLFFFIFNMSKLDDIDYLTKLIYEYLYQKIQSRPIESKPLDTNYLEDLTIVKKIYEGKQLSELVKC